MVVPRKPSLLEIAQGCRPVSVGDKSKLTILVPKVVLDNQPKLVCHLFKRSRKSLQASIGQ
eukprot:3210044-Amphidinium_carterae.1